MEINKIRVLLVVREQLSKHDWGVLALVLSKRFSNVTCLKEGFSVLFKEFPFEKDMIFFKNLATQMLVEEITIERN